MTKHYSTNEIIQKEKDYVLGTYPRLPFVLHKGEGAYLYDIEGKKYLDFGSGIAVTSLGHGNAQVVKSIQEQADTLSHVSNLYHSVPHTLLAEKLCQLSFADKVFFSNSGAEAVEASLKFARKYAQQKFGEGKTKFVAFTQGFHGRTFGALSVTAREKYQKPFRPLLQDVAVAEYNNISSAKEAITEDTCAVILEVVQGEGGVNVGNVEFIHKVRELATKHNALLIVDEIQSGVGRTGKLWAYEHFEIKPDIMTVAKALGGGLPIGATLMTNAVAETISAGDHGSTFGGGPVATQAALTVLEQIADETFLKNVTEASQYLKAEIEALGHPDIIEVRTLGLMIGIEMKIEVSDFYQKAHEYGILILTAGPNVIRLLPPLILTTEIIDEFITSFKQLIEVQAK